jgi:hypothetical protein
VPRSPVIGSRIPGPNPSTAVKSPKPGACRHAYRDVTWQGDPVPQEKRGRYPYGWNSAGPIRQEQAARWLMGHLTLAGWPQNRIARHLDSLGIPPRHGGQWSRESVRKIAAAELADRAESLADTG